MASLEALYQAYAPMVARRAEFLLRDEDAAWDIVQAVFLRLAERPHLLNRVHSPTAYLWQMTTRQCFDFLTRSRQSLPWTEEDLPSVPSGDDEVVGRIVLHSLFAGLPRRTQELAWYRWVDQMTWDEIALATGLSVPGARKHLDRFVQKVRQRREKHI